MRQADAHHAPAVMSEDNAEAMAAQHTALFV